MANGGVGKSKGTKSEVDYSKSPDIKKVPFAEQITMRMKPYMESLVSNLEGDAIHFFDEYIKSLNEKPCVLSDEDKRVLESIDEGVYKSLSGTDALNDKVDKVLDKFDEILESLSAEDSDDEDNEKVEDVVKDAVMRESSKVDTPVKSGYVTVLSLVSSLKKAFDAYVRKSSPQSAEVQRVKREERLREERKDEKNRVEQDKRDKQTASYRQAVGTTLKRQSRSLRKIGNKLVSPLVKVLKLLGFIFLGGWITHLLKPFIKNIFWPAIKTELDNLGLTKVWNDVTDKLEKDFPGLFALIEEVKKKVEIVSKFVSDNYDALTTGLKKIFTSIMGLSRWIRYDKNGRQQFWYEKYKEAGLSPSQDAHSYSETLNKVESANGYDVDLDFKAAERARAQIKMEYEKEHPEVAVQRAEAITSKPDEYTKPNYIGRKHVQGYEKNEEVSKQLTQAVQEEAQSSGSRRMARKYGDAEIEAYTNKETGDVYITQRDSKVVQKVYNYNERALSQ